MLSLIVHLRRGAPLVLLVALAACSTTSTRKSSSPSSSSATRPPASSSQTSAPAKPAGSSTAPQLSSGASHQAEMDAIFALAKKNRWDEAEMKAYALYEMDPQDPSVQRVYGWVTKQRELRQDQMLEDKIREIDANNSFFNPSIPDLVTESKDRGLPPRKDVRDAIDQIQSTPYIPPTYGKTIHKKGMLFDLETEQGRMAKILDKEISVHLDNVTLEAIIFTVGQAEGINFVADKSLPAFAQKLSVNVDKVKLREFLNYVSRNLEVQFQVGNDLIWIIDAKDPKRLQEETRFYRLRKGFVLPALFGPTEVVQVKTTNPQNNITTVQETQKINKFVNDGAPEIPAIEKAIKDFAGTNVTYQIDYERNLIVARGTRERLEVLEKIIQEFDKTIQQVLIEARFVTLSQPAFMQLGVLWETGRQFSTTRLPNDFTSLVDPTQIPGVGLGIQQVFTNVLNSSTLTATISALEQNGESQTLSAPRLTVINNRPATISDGKVQYYYEEYTVASTVQQYYTSSSFVPTGKPTKITSGAELDVMASIAGDGKSLVLALRPRVNTDVQLVKFATVTQYNGGVGANNIQSTFDIMLPQYRTEELATRVVVKSGQTVVMGGVLEREQTTFVESVPVLGNLPILGALFRRRSEIDKPRYLLIFVTATILSDSGEFVIYDDEEK